MKKSVFFACLLLLAGCAHDPAARPPSVGAGQDHGLGEARPVQMPAPAGGVIAVVPKNER